MPCSTSARSAAQRSSQGSSRRSVSWRWTWLVTGCAAIGIAVVAAGRHGAPQVRHGRRTSPAQVLAVQTLAEPPLAPVKGSGSLFRSFTAIKEQGLVLLVLAFAATAVVEGGIDTWGVLYLRTTLATGVLLGAGAYAAGQLIAATTRASGSNLMNRLGHRRGFVLGAGLAAAGLALEASSNSVPVAACALAVAAGGISLCWPLTMARLAAPRPGQARPTPRRQRFSSGDSRLRATWAGCSGPPWWARCPITKG